MHCNIENNVTERFFENPNEKNFFSCQKVLFSYYFYYFCNGNFTSKYFDRNLYVNITARKPTKYFDSKTS